MSEAQDRTAAAPNVAAPGFSQQWKWLSWVLVVLVVGAALVIGVVDQTEQLSPAERSSAIARTIRCPQCRGQSVAESNVSIARQIRADIAQRVDSGETDEQIQQAYVDIFDDESILLTPSSTGFASLVWIVPVVTGAVAALALAFAFHRWRDGMAAVNSSSTTQSSDADRALVEQARAEQTRGQQS